MKFFKPKKLKLFLIAVIFVLAGVLFFSLINQAQAQVDPGLEPVGEYIALSTQDIRVTIARIIQVFLGLLGVIAVVLVLYGGFLYMTAAGVAEKVDKAKKVLVSAAIGLVIVLTAFAIASFVLIQLQQATGPGGGVIGDNDTGPADDDVVPGGDALCPNPGDSNPWLCIKANPDGSRSAPKGSLITLYGGNINFPAGTIFFNDTVNDNSYEAEVVPCEEGSDWFTDIPFSTLKTVTVRVPVDLPDGVTNYRVSAEADGGTPTTLTKDWRIAERLDDFTLADGDPGLDIICFVENNAGVEGARIFSAEPAQAIFIKGERFGSSAGNIVYNADDTADAGLDTVWTETLIDSTVPVTASGNVRVTAYDGGDADQEWLNITCNTGADCSTGCCQRQSGTYFCVETEQCLGGLGDDCILTGGGGSCGSEGFECRSDLYCDPVECECKRREAGAPCSSDELSCVPDDNLCGSSLYCSQAEGCFCQYLPEIGALDPQTGGPGNFVTIWGQGFGNVLNTNTKVIFLGEDTDGNGDPEGDADDVEAILPLNCGASNIWQDDQVIIEIPDGAVTGGLKLYNSDGLFDDTNDADGYVGDFTVDETVNYPALCAVVPNSGEFETSVSLSGKNFGDETEGQALIGGIQFLQGDNWDWDITGVDLDVISGAQVPNLQPATLPVQILSNGVYSNTFNFTVVELDSGPEISYINPVRGPEGQYITIFGKNFGSEIGNVYFRDSGDNNVSADFSFPDVCADNYWHDTYITVKVPDNLGGTDPLSTQIIVETKQRLQTAPVDFERCALNPTTCPLTPGLCAIDPEQGPIATGVDLFGDNLGSNQGEIYFYNNQTANIDSWADQQVQARVPTDATTGPVYAVDQSGNVSNQLPFTVGDCRDADDPAEFCDTANTGNICCDLDGVCQTEIECYGEPAPMCYYGWTFATGQRPGVFDTPRVVEDITCVDDTQSPSPWRDSDNNCRNAVISARFNMRMNASSLNKINIWVEECASANFSTCNIDPGWRDQATVSVIPIKRGFTYTPPPDSLQPGTWYKVTLRGGGTGSRPDSAIKSEYGVYLDGNEDGLPGGDYVWYFRVRDLEDECILDNDDKVVVSPNQVTLENLSETVDYSAYAMKANCNILNGDGFEWDWYKIYSDGTVEDAPITDLSACEAAYDPTEKRKYCIADLSEVDADSNGYTDWQQVATPLKQGRTFVGAEVFNQSDDNNQLVIDLNIPEITRIYPDNGLLHPDVNAYVDIYGTNFGVSRGSSQVLFDNVVAPTAPNCGNAWHDDHIKVLVPKPLPIQSTGQETYTSINIDQTNTARIYYNFEGDSNVILEDRVSNNNGEIFGATRVGDQFGQSMFFNGTDSYVKLPNTYNLQTGSVEFLFKPRNFTAGQEQTLLSLSDGTADNLLALSFIPDNDSQAKFYVRQTNGGSPAGTNTTVPVINSDEWHYLAYTYDGDKYYFYINGHKFYSFSGSNVAASTFTDAWFNADVPVSDVVLGASKTDDFSAYYDGLMDNFVLYQRVLPENEIRDRYGLRQGQILLLNFEGLTSQVIDSSANGFSGLEASQVDFRTEDGRYGKALANATISVNDNQSLNFSNQIAVEGWFKTANSGNSFTIFDTNNIQLGNINCDGNKFCFKLLLTDQAEPTDIAGQYYAAIATNNITADQWNYFAAYYDGSDIKLYLNNNEAEYTPPFAPGRVKQLADFGQAVIGHTSIELDNFALYNRALSDSEISSRLGTKNGADVIVRTAFGEARSSEETPISQYFYHSDLVYPFICELNPNSGLEGTQIEISGENYGDSNTTVYQGQRYDLGSLINFDLIPFARNNIDAWSNIMTSFTNPFSDYGKSKIPVTVQIDPAAEPFIDEDGLGTYDPGEDYADILEPFGQYNEGNYSIARFDPADPADVTVDTLPAVPSNTEYFYLKPVITSITPDNGPNEQWVTIRGYNFGEYVEGSSKVIFSDNEVAGFPPEPCKFYWTDRQIIVVVPEDAITGDVYLNTALGLTSNRVTYTVNDKPLGPGLCQLVPDMGYEGQVVVAQGDGFEDTQGNSNVYYHNGVAAGIQSWDNNNIATIVPTGARDGNVIVTKQVVVDQRCIGFQIGSFCPSNSYEDITEDVASNPIYFDVYKSCEQSDVALIKNDEALSASYPVVPSSANNSLVSSDGQYLYTKARAGDYSWGSMSDINRFEIVKNGDDVEIGSLNRTYEALNAIDGQKALKWSMTYHSNGRFYLGYNEHLNGQNKIWYIDFQDNGGVYQYEVKSEDVPVQLMKWNDANVENLSTSVQIASNGQYVFNLASIPDGPDWHVIRGYKLKVFDPNNNWRKIKEFEIYDNDNFKSLYVSDFVVAGDIVYPIVFGDRVIPAFNWKTGQWVTDWQSHSGTNEVSGQYDWINNVFWLGEWREDENTNRIYQYQNCPFAECEADTDCARCGAGTSQCINGRCTPYISEFSPEDGPIGTFVNIYGCYFGCSRGDVYFYDEKEAVFLDDPDCGRSWQCNTSDQLCDPGGVGCDKVIVEVPNRYTAETTDDAGLGAYPINLRTAYGFSTESDNDFTVNNDPLSHQICNLIPSYGNRGVSFRIHGEGFGEDGSGAGDYVYFGLEPPLQVREPWRDTITDGDGYTSGEPFIDFNGNDSWDNFGVFNNDDYSFEISSYTSEPSNCGDGWTEKDICVNVPQDMTSIGGIQTSAAGQGNNLEQAFNNVIVYKDSADSNSALFDVTFGLCGNYFIDTGESCDGTALPNLTPQELNDTCAALFPTAPDEQLVDCYMDCTNMCSLQFCIEDDCINETDLCGNGVVDNYPVIGYFEECDDGNNIDDDDCSNTCQLVSGDDDADDDTDDDDDDIPDPPQVIATVPDHNSQQACRNGIIEIYFDQRIANSTITKDNFKLQYCDGSQSITKGADKGFVAKTLAYFKNIFKKLLGQKTSLAALSCASYTDLTTDYSVTAGQMDNGMTMVSLVPDGLLDPAEIYRVRVSGDVTNQTGDNLDNSNSPVVDTTDYVFDFATLGDQSDPDSGICNVESIDIRVYRSNWTASVCDGGSNNDNGCFDNNDCPGGSCSGRPFSIRTNDLFICANNNCRLVVDYDQDFNTAGNQHIYQAIGRYDGGQPLQADYKWTRNPAFDPDNAISIYGTEDLDPNLDIVANDTGVVYTTAAQIKESVAKLVVEAQALGSTVDPVQKEFLVYILLCENPWPSINEKFPITSIINAYNFQLYYCRDAGVPGDPTDDLPAARWLFPDIANLSVLGNNDFERGILGSDTMWPTSGGQIFNFDTQPVYSDITLIRDGVSSSIQGSWWISTRENYRRLPGQDVNTTSLGPSVTDTLQSQAFAIEGDQVRFLVGGTETDAGILDNFDETNIDSPPNPFTGVILAIREDPNDPNYQVYAKTTGSGSTAMQEMTFDTKAIMTGRPCQTNTDCNGYGQCECDGECSSVNIGQCSPIGGIIYVYDNDPGGYINFDNLRQYKDGVEIPLRF